MVREWSIQRLPVDSKVLRPHEGLHSWLMDYVSRSQACVERLCPVSMQFVGKSWRPSSSISSFGCSAAPTPPFPRTPACHPRLRTPMSPPIRSAPPPLDTTVLVACDVAWPKTSSRCASASSEPSGVRVCARAGGGGDYFVVPGPRRGPGARPQARLPRRLRTPRTATGKPPFPVNRGDINGAQRRPLASGRSGARRASG